MMDTRISTTGMDHEAWLRQRKKGIGGSDAGAVCGLNPYTSPIQVYLDKTTEEIKDIDNESMRQGRDLEEYVAQRFMEESGKKVRRSNMIYKNQKYPFMFANVDRLIVGENAGLECKTASAYSADKWKDDAIPPHYLIQCYHYMTVTNADAWYLAVVILGKEFKFIRLERDEAMIQNLISIEQDLWENHVLKKVMPQPDGSKASEELIKQYFAKADFNKTISLSGFHEKLERRLELDALIDKLDKEKKQIEQEVKLYMEDAELAVGEDFIVSWKNVTTAKIDTAKLKEENPQIYEQYLKQQQSRRFSIKAA